MSKRYRTTKAEFARFKKEALRWIRFFGLLDYEICIYHRGTNARAQCYFNEEGRIATLDFCLDWGEKPDPLEVEKVAFHEVCEILTMRLQRMAGQHFQTHLVQERAHELIRRLENSIWPLRESLLHLQANRR